MSPGNCMSQSNSSNVNRACIGCGRAAQGRFYNTYDRERIYFCSSKCHKNHNRQKALSIPNILKMANETEEKEEIVEDDSDKEKNQGDTIFDACRGGEDNFRMLQKMISEKEDVNQRNENGETPLGIAVCIGDMYTMDALINAGADVELSDSQQMTPLMMAAQLGFDSKLGFLLKNGANAMALDKGGQTALHKTIRNKTVKCASALIDHCSELVHVKDRMEQTTLHFAAGEGNDELIDLLIGHGAEVDLVDRLGRAALHWAILQGMDASAKKIGEHGGTGTLDSQDKLGMRPLHYALQQNKDSISTNLINQGCDVDALDIRGQSGLVYASACGRTDMCGMILDNSKNKNSVDKKGWTALHHAAQKNHASICSFLLDHGLDGDVQNDEGHTALVLAVMNENTDTVKTLCEKLNEWTLVKDQHGRYPIHYAAERGHHDIMEILINALKRKCDSELIVKAIICTPDTDGASALQMAATLNFKSCCQLLLDNDADVDDKARPHLVRMGLIEDTPEEEEEEEETDGKKEEDTKEPVMTPIERYAPPATPPSTASSDDIKSISLSELLRDDDSKHEVEDKRPIESEMKNRNDKLSRSKLRKNERRKSPYSNPLLPPEIYEKYTTGYLPPQYKSRLSGRINSCKSESSSRSQPNKDNNNNSVDGQPPCRLKGTLDPNQRQNSSSTSPSTNNSKYSYLLKKK